VPRDCATADRIILRLPYHGHPGIRGDDAWQVGLANLKGNVRAHNRFYDGESPGAVAHFNEHNSVMLPEAAVC
jgi:hypothetical protein